MDLYKAKPSTPKKIKDEHATIGSTTKSPIKSTINNEVSATIANDVPNMLKTIAVTPAVKE